MAGQFEDIVVFRVRGKDSRCSDCGEEMRGALLRKEGERGLKYSPFRAVVVEWGRTRKRYEH